MLGAADGQPARRVRAAVSMAEIRYNEVAWVAGDQVDRYLAAGHLIPVGA